MTQNRFYSSTAQKTALTGSITNAVTSIVVSATVGFPVSFPYTLILDRDTVSEEVVKVTAAAGTTLTVARGQDGTSAVAHSLGATVEHGVSAQDFSEPQAHMGTGAAVHGLTGSVVGTTDAQTLANKTLSSPTLNTPTVNNPALSGTATGSLAGATLTSPTLNTPTVTNPTLSGSGGALGLPAGPETLVGRDTTDTLTNKTLTNPTINGATLDAASTIGGISGTTLATEHGGSAAYTPTLGGVTSLGSGGYKNFRYLQQGKLVTVWGQIGFGSGRSLSGTFTISLPKTSIAVNGLGGLILGHAYAEIASTGASNFGFIYWSTTTTIAIRTSTSDANWSATVPVAWASSDVYHVQFQYEAA